MKIKTLAVSIIFATISFHVFASGENFDGAGMTLKDIIYVGGSGEGNYTSIQAAIHDISKNGTIIVYPGVYNENLFIYKPLILKSRNGSSSTIISSSFDVIKIYANYVKIDGFTIENGHEAGVLISGKNCNVVNSIIKNNIKGVYMDGCYNVTLINNTFEDNLKVGIHVMYSSNFELLGNKVKNSNYGIHIYHSSNGSVLNNEVSNGINGVTLDKTENVTVSANRVSNTHGGIFLYESSNISVVKNFLYHNNYSISTAYSSNNTILKNRIVYGMVSGIYLDQSDNNTIRGNMVVRGKGYGIVLSFSNNNDLERNLVFYNKNYGIDVSHSKNNTVKMNIALFNGCGFYLKNADNNTISFNVGLFNGIDLKMYCSPDNYFMMNIFLTRSQSAV